MRESERSRGWEGALERWLAPFLAALGREAQRRWAPVYLKGLILPGERKSVEPLAARVAPGSTEQLHHFIGGSPWVTGPLEAVLAEEADRLGGGPEAGLGVDAPALPKQGKHSVGVARQYCGCLGKRANCQVLVSLTLARGEVPVPVGLRLFLPAEWTADPGRCARAGVPEEHRRPLAKPGIALEEVDRVIAAGVRFGRVLADAGYGAGAAFRRGLSARGLLWARHQGAARGRVRRPAGAPGRGRAAQERLAPARRGGLAGRRAPGLGRAQVLPLEPRSGRAPGGAGGADQGALGVRAGAPAAQGGAGARPLRGPELARAAPPRAPVPAPPPPPAAPAARGKKASPPRPSPGHRPGRACPPSGGASWPCLPASCCAAPAAGSASSITSDPECPRVVLGRVLNRARRRLRRGGWRRGSGPPACR